MHPESSTHMNNNNNIIINPSTSFPEHEHLKCPRCDSTNTKFCYYNNYNFSQPRHFCKNCRRYWTKGGTLRNIPIGGATRKINKRKHASIPNKLASPATAPKPKPEPEPPHVYQVESGGFSSLLGTNSMGPFRNLLMDGLSSNLVGKSHDADDDVLIRNRNPIAVDFRSNLLRLNENSNHNGWPDLSIFTPGSSFH